MPSSRLDRPFDIAAGRSVETQMEPAGGSLASQKQAGIVEFVGRARAHLAALIAAAPGLSVGRHMTDGHHETRRQCAVRKSRAYAHPCPQGFHWAVRAGMPVVSLRPCHSLNVDPRAFFSRSGLRMCLIRLPGRIGPCAGCGRGRPRFADRYPRSRWQESSRWASSALPGAQ